MSDIWKVKRYRKMLDEFCEGMEVTGDTDYVLAAALQEIKRLKSEQASLKQKLKLTTAQADKLSEINRLIRAVGYGKG